MPVLNSSQAREYDLHGSRFTSYVAPSLGSERLCAWRLAVEPGTVGAEHRVSTEEVLFVTDGPLRVTIDDVRSDAPQGAVVFVPAGSSFRVDGGERRASAWVVTTAGLQAVLADGSTLTPPWTV
ncbi:MAG TPA: cupin domain-containing protein [Jatrophihabitantaceae bacterium]|jgi:quercetin dioxygenase-like cupin family protein|nr:cupin domain-containing protein [Jatrophihabitantaceae bacterium]